MVLGKSTTIGILSSIVNKTSGVVKIFDIDISDNFPKGAESYLGVVAQEINFSQFEKVSDIVLTQAGFYGIPYSIAVKRTEKLLKKLALWNKRDDQARNLSGGQKKEADDCKSIGSWYKLLILDEAPTAGVDIELRREMWEFLSSINQNGTTIILTTHYLEEAEQHCKNIAIIDHGEIVEDTNMKELLSRLSVQSFVLDLESPIDTLPKSTNFNLTLSDKKTLMATLTEKDDLNTLFNELSEKGIKIKSMRNEQNRLEELFINLVKEKDE